MKPLRILHVANFNQFKYGEWYMNLDAKLSLGLAQLGHAVYDFSQRDIARAESPFKSKKMGRKAMLSALFKVADNFKPELVILGHTEMISADVISELRAKLPDTRFAMWYCDALFKAHADARGIELVNEKAPLLDVLFTTTGIDTMKEVVNSDITLSHVPNWVHKACESGTAFSSQQLKHQLIFAGNDYNEPARSAFLKELSSSESGIDFKIYQALGNPRIHGQSYYNELSQSLMGLSLSRRFDVPWYTSDRMQQEMGNGVCTISPRTPGITDLFLHDEVVWFDNESEIVELVKWFANHEEEARAIGERGWRAVHSRCAADRVAKFMLEITFGMPLSEDYEWASQISAASIH